MYIKYYASIFVKSVCINVYIVKESLKRHMFINTQAYARKNKTVNPKGNQL